MKKWTEVIVPKEELYKVIEKFKGKDYIIVNNEDNNLTLSINENDLNSVYNYEKKRDVAQEKIDELKKDKKSMELDPHDGEEFGYVIQGKVTLVHGEEEYEVKKGETFYLKGNLPHYLMNKNDTLAKVIWVSTPPIF